MNAPFPHRHRELIVDSFAGGGGTSEGIRAAIGREVLIEAKPKRPSWED